MSPIVPQPIPFKLFGLQRTGTNLILALLTRNFQVHSLEIGSEWKHGRVAEPNRQWQGVPACFVHCVKNPYAWLFSCYRYFQGANGVDATGVLQFQRQPTMPFEQFVLGPCYDFANPVQRWNEMNRHWVETLPLERTVLVRQEDQLHKQIPLLERVEQKLGLTRKWDPLQEIDRKVDVNATLQGPMNRDYYLTGGYLAEFSPALLETVNAQLDLKLMRLLGYLPES